MFLPAHTAKPVRGFLGTFSDGGRELFRFGAGLAKKGRRGTWVRFTGDDSSPEFGSFWRELAMRFPGVGTWASGLL